MVRLTVVILCCITACSSLKTTGSQNDQSLLANSRTAAINCADPTSYDLAVVEGPIRSVKVVVGDKLARSIDVPSGSEISGFSLSWARKTKDGFDLSVEYGSRFYYGKRFIFSCKDDDLLLTNIAIESFDRNNPSKWTKKDVSIKPPVPIGRFKLTDYTHEGEIR